MRKVFIDLGAGSGDDVDGYYKLDRNNINHEVFAFEANPVRAESLKKRYPEITVLTAAAGVEDGFAKLYLGNHLNTSSLSENKVSVDTSRYINVQVLHFSKWMKENFSPEDHITLVIDIEGAEYEVLQDMLDENLWEWIEQMYVEFHGNKLEGFDIEIENTLTKKLIDFYGDDVYIFRKHQHEQFLKLNAEGS